MSFPVYAIGESTSSLVSLDSLGLPTPKATAPDYETYVDSGDGLNSGQGWLSCQWRFSHLSLAHAAILQGYEGVCGVRTLTYQGTYLAYSAIMILPPRKTPKVDFVEDYVVEFRQLVAV